MLDRKRQIIMLVDDNPATLSMGKSMLKNYYEVYALPSAERLFKFLESVTPDLILLDVAMPNMSGFDILRVIRANEQYKGIPVIFVTSKTAETDELEGLALGAVDYVAKPFSAAILLKRIENHLLIKKQEAELRNLNNNLAKLVEEKVTRIFGLQSSIISSIAEIVEFRDAFTGGHIIQTQKYMRLLMDYLAENNLYPEEVQLWADLDHIVSSTQLHDLGKIFISDAILNKPGKLTAEEFETMKTHVAKGAEIIANMKRKETDHAFLNWAETVAKTHHEKWDGNGYPAGLKGPDIPLLGRLMAIADVYDALTSARPYKQPFSPDEAARIIIEGSGTHFDPKLVDVFKALQNEFAAVV